MSAVVSGYGDVAGSSYKRGRLMHRACVLLARVGLTALVAATMMMVMGGARAEAASPCGHVRRAPRWHHIVVISFENHSYQQVLGKTAPRSYFKTLASKCGSAD